MRKLKPITSERYTALEEAHMMLLRAQAIFRNAGALRTYQRVKFAVSSSKGALRHARHRAMQSGAKLIVRLPAANTEMNVSTSLEQELLKLLNQATDTLDAGATVQSCFAVLQEGFENVGYPQAALGARLMAQAFDGRDQ